MALWLHDALWLCLLQNDDTAGFGGFDEPAGDKPPFGGFEGGGGGDDFGFGTLPKKQPSEDFGGFGDSVRAPHPPFRALSLCVVAVSVLLCRCLLPGLALLYRVPHAVLFAATAIDVLFHTSVPTVQS